MKKEIKKSIQ